MNTDLEGNVSCIQNIAVCGSHDVPTTTCGGQLEKPRKSPSLSGWPQCCHDAGAWFRRLGVEAQQVSDSCCQGDARTLDAFPWPA